MFLFFTALSSIEKVYRTIVLAMGGCWYLAAGRSDLGGGDIRILLNYRKRCWGEEKITFSNHSPHKTLTAPTVGLDHARLGSTRIAQKVVVYLDYGRTFPVGATVNIARRAISPESSGTVDSAKRFRVGYGSR